MRLAKPEERSIAVQIITETFRDNPHFNFILRKNNRELALREMAHYAFDKGMRRQGVYLTSDNKGLLIAYKNNTPGSFWSDTLSTFRILLFSLSLAKLSKIRRHENFIQARRPVGEYLYCWFFCVKKDARGRSAPREIRDYVLERSIRENLPILAETTLERNKFLFERFGFRMYDQIVNPEGLKVWMMKRELQQNAVVPISPILRARKQETEVTSALAAG